MSAVSAARPIKRQVIGQARIQALALLTRIDQSGLTLDAVLDSSRNETAHWPAADRALLTALIFGVLRWRARLDWLIAQFSKTPLKRMDPAIRMLLRLASFQICFLDRVPPSAAVNSAVELAKTLGPPWVVKFVNALLRNMVRRHAGIAFPDARTDPIGHIAAVQSMPRSLAARWIERFGFDDANALCRAVNAIAPLTIRANTLQIEPAALLARLAADGQPACRARLAPEAIHLCRPHRPVDQMSAFQAGLFQVQDEAAQLVARLVNPRPGETILDACAGLGGKTTHLAQLMRNTGHILAMDLHPQRLDGLQDAIARLAATHVSIARADIRHGPLRPCRFDRILLDAPCSGAGVIRRNPDTKWRLKNDFKRYQRRQLRLLDDVAPLVTPGGLLVYAVCSFEPEETGQVIERFRQVHSNFSIDRGLGILPEPAAALIDDTGAFVSYPHSHNMDGFYAIRLRRHDHA